MLSNNGEPIGDPPLPCQGWGREFKSHRPLHFFKDLAAASKPPFLIGKHRVSTGGRFRPLYGPQTARGARGGRRTCQGAGEGGAVLCGLVRDLSSLAPCGTPPDRPPVIEVAESGQRQARVRCWSGAAVPARPGPATGCPVPAARGPCGGAPGGGWLDHDRLGHGAGIGGRCERPGETPLPRSPLRPWRAGAVALLCHSPKTSAPKFPPAEIVGLALTCGACWAGGAQAIKADPEAPWAPE